MRNIRVIARLDVKGKNVINTIHLEGLRVCGDPNQLALRYYEQGADELLIIDQVASLYQRGHLLELTRAFAENIFIPVTVGGGVRTVDDARILLRSGADKIAINSAALECPEIISALAQEFGSQCIVLSVQAKQIREGEWEAFKDGGRERSGKNVLRWVEEAVERGAGEILVTSIDRDGTRKGFDIHLLDKVTAPSWVPVIAGGGFGRPAHALELLSRSRCEAISIADFLHMERGGGVAEVKTALREGKYVLRELEP